MAIRPPPPGQFVDPFRHIPKKSGGQCRAAGGLYLFSAGPTGPGLPVVQLMDASCFWWAMRRHRVGVMQAGRLEQLGPPTEIYSRPATPFVAEFVGLTNRIPGEVKFGGVEVRGTQLPLVQSDVKNGPVIALVRPEAVTLASEGDASHGLLVGTVIAVAFLGATSRVTVDLGDIIVLAQMPTSAAAEHPAGTKVRLTLRPDPVLIQREEATAVRA